MELVIRNEYPTDYRRVEEITRQAFWNLHSPGCDEHFLTHIMRGHPDFMPDLDFVIEKNNEVIGNIMYTKATLTDEDGRRHEIATFGPVSILPEYQRLGYGSLLIRHSLDKARLMNLPSVVIYGNPNNYVSLGFKSCKRFNICNTDGAYPSALLVVELQEGILATLGSGRKTYSESPVYALDPVAAEAFDATFEPMEKKVTPGQEVFFIMSQSTMAQNL